MRIAKTSNSFLVNREEADGSSFFVLIEAIMRYNAMQHEGVVFHHHTQASNKMIQNIIDYENYEQDSGKLSMLETLIADALMAGNMLPVNVQDETKM